MANTTENSGGETFILENNILKVIFNSIDASISYIINKSSGDELVDIKRKSVSLNTLIVY